MVTAVDRNGSDFVRNPSRRRWLFAVPVFVAGGVVVTALLFSRDSEHTVIDTNPVATSVSVSGMPATRSQADDLMATFRRYERTVFDALVSGDPAHFPEVFYNDAEIPPPTWYDDYREEHRVTIEALLASSNSGPVGAPTGYLSAEVASFLVYDEDASAWEDVVATASAEGRPPSTRDLPGDAQPIERKHPAEWIETDVYIHRPLLLGDHATATFSFGTATLDGMLEHMTFTRVEGRWYISGISYSGRP